MERALLRQAILAKVEGETGEKLDKLDESANLRTDLGMDSVDLLQLVISVQSEYGIILQSKELQKVVLIGDFLDLLQAKLSTDKRAVA